MRQARGAVKRARSTSTLWTMSNCSNNLTIDSNTSNNKYNSKYNNSQCSNSKYSSNGNSPGTRGVAVTTNKETLTPPHSNPPARGSTVPSHPRLPEGKVSRVADSGDFRHAARDIQTATHTVVHITPCTDRRTMEVHLGASTPTMVVDTQRRRAL
eukprot:Opistho-2@94036